MLSPAYVNIISFFYPLGNTPAVCLTQDLPLGEEATILLLGSGDLRNILFTSYADGDSALLFDLENRSGTNLRLSVTSSRCHLLRR
jgi:Domain of unknown function (DUF4470)